jgi:hypothetical protein
MAKRIAADYQLDEYYESTPLLYRFYLDNPERFRERSVFDLRLLEKQFPADEAARAAIRDRLQAIADAQPDEPAIRSGREGKTPTSPFSARQAACWKMSLGATCRRAFGPFFSTLSQANSWALSRRTAGCIWSIFSPEWMTRSCPSRRRETYRRAGRPFTSPRVRGESKKRITSAASCARSTPASTRRLLEGSSEPSADNSAEPAADASAASLEEEKDPLAI